MGCICSKGIETDEIVEDIKKGSSRSLTRLVTPLKKEDAAILFDTGSGRNGTRLATRSQENVIAPIPVQPDKGEKKGALASVERNQNPIRHQRRATVDVRVNGADHDSTETELVDGKNFYELVRARKRWHRMEARGRRGGKKASTENLADAPKDWTENLSASSNFMIMGISVATPLGLSDVLSGSCFGQFATYTHLTTPFNPHSKSKRRRCTLYLKLQSNSRIGQNSILINGTQEKLFNVKEELKKSQFLKCKCQRADGFTGISSEDGNGALRKEVPGMKSQLLHENAFQKVLGVDEIKHLKRDNREIITNDVRSAPHGVASYFPPNNKGSRIEDEALDLLQESIVYYCGTPVGTIAAKDLTDGNALNYDQVFIRDFIPSGIAFLLRGEYDIVRNFILHTLQLQSWEKTMDCHSPGQGLMPASFKVRTVPLDGDDSATEEVLDPDFGEAAIGRVAPVDSGLWWIILLRAYGKCSGDLSVQERIDVQTGIKMILKLCLSDGFDMFPTLLVTDGSCMIDRRMGIHGHPLEIQALFYSALLCAREMLAPEDGSADIVRALNNRLIALSFHMREYYWVDMKKLNEIYRYKTEEYSYDAVNKFNIYPDQIPPWLVEWMPDRGGYLIGNLQPAHMDFRFFSLGNLWSIVSSLATTQQSHAILDLIEDKWSDLVADMPLKICYPSLEGMEWRIITGSDPKNTPWSYHNGGSWPTLLWQLTVACIKMNRPELAARAVEVAEKRLSDDKWPEYYDSKSGRFIGKQSRLYQTWSIAGFLVAKLLLAKPDAAKILWNEEDADIMSAINFMTDSGSPRRKRGRKPLKKTFIV